MLSPDPDLPFLVMAWSCTEMVEFFNRDVLPVLRPWQRARTVSILDMTYFPGRKCDVLYSLQTGTAPTGADQWATVTFMKGGRAERIYTRHYGAGAPRSTDHAAPTNAIVLPEYGCLVELFPSDYGLPSLVGALDIDTMASLVGDGQRHIGTSSACSCAAEVLRYRPRLRCVIRYALGSGRSENPLRLVGKVYPSKENARQAWQWLNSFHAQAEVAVRIPQPMMLVDDRSLVVMESLSGTSMNHMLRRATTLGEAEDLVHLAARALVWLHSVKPSTQEGWSLGAAVEHVRLLTARVHLVAPKLAGEARALLDRIVRLINAGEGTVLCIHGDCKPSQFLMNEGRAALVDFDKACLGPPAADLGNFMAALHTEALRDRDFGRGLADAFITEYEGRSGRGDLRDQVRVFQAASLVRSAVRSFKRSPHHCDRDDPNSFPARLLREAATCLAGL